MIILTFSSKFDDILKFFLLSPIAKNTYKATFFMYIVKPKNTRIRGSASPVVENFLAKLQPKSIKPHSIINSRHKKEEI